MTTKLVVDAAALDTIRTDHITAAGDSPTPIPVRWCPNPYTSILGHLVFGPEVRDGDTISYSLSFTAGPLHGESPRFVLCSDSKESL